MRPNMAFKYGLSVGFIAAISILCGIIYLAFIEYDPTHLETIGIIMIVTCATAGAVTLLWALIELIKWKPT